MICSPVDFNSKVDFDKKRVQSENHGGSESCPIRNSKSARILSYVDTGQRVDDTKSESECESGDVGQGRQDNGWGDQEGEMKGKQEACVHDGADSGGVGQGEGQFKQDLTVMRA